MLREGVTFQRKSRTRNATGGFTEAWATLKATHASVKALSGSERYASDRVEATARYRIVVRYFSDLTEEDRVLIRGRVYQIRFINNVEFADRWLQIDLDAGMAT
jgi:SPP1 family predicted phage head-tail adaptor